MDCLTAQLEFVGWLMRVAKFQYAELESKIKIDLKQIRANISNFLFHFVKPNFEECVQDADEGKINRLVSWQEEDQEQVCKSKMRLLTSFYVLLE